MLSRPGERLHVLGVRGDQIRAAVDGATDPVGIGDVGFVATAEVLADLFGPQLVEGIDLYS